VNPPAAVQRPAAGPASLSRRGSRTPFLLGALAVAGALLISQLLAAPHFVSRITVDNRSGYALLVEVSDAHGDSWLPVGTIDRKGSTSFEQVYDVGDAWQFRLTAQTVGLGTVRVSRSQLERSNWHVEIPKGLGDPLRERAVAAQP
jgi:hypothetical protein